jgi:hypothetical protein
MNENKIKPVWESCSDKIALKRDKDGWLSKDNGKYFVAFAILEAQGFVFFGHEPLVEVAYIEKAEVNGKSRPIFAASKRRGVDRRIIHELREKFSPGYLKTCHIGVVEREGEEPLCGECPACLIFGTLQYPSRIRYADSVAIEEDAVQELNKNIIDELKLTSGAILTQEAIKPGTHFPIYTFGRWMTEDEFGGWAYAFLSAIRQGRYTSRGAAHGKLDIATINGEPAVFLLESDKPLYPSIFRISIVETDYKTLSQRFANFEIKTGPEAMQKTLSELLFFKGTQCIEKLEEISDKFCRLVETWSKGKSQ